MEKTGVSVRLLAVKIQANPSKENVYFKNIYGVIKAKSQIHANPNFLKDSTAREFF